MSQRSLHVIIGLVLLSVFVYFATDVFNKNYVPNTPSRPKAIQPSPEPSELLADCTGPYINVHEGATWKYRISSTSDSAADKTQKQKGGQSILVVTLIRKETGKLFFVTKDTTAKKQTNTTIECKMSGNYGLPIFSSLDSINILPKEFLEALSQQILFIPNRRVYKDRTWTSVVDITSLLPIKIQGSPTNMNFKVVKEGTMNVQAKKYQTVFIKSSSDSKGAIDISSFFAISYTLGEEIGFIDGELQLKIPTKGTYNIDITLESFLNPL